MVNPSDILELKRFLQEDADFERLEPTHLETWTAQASSASGQKAT